jgi:hypothetical protein
MYQLKVDLSFAVPLHWVLQGASAYCSNDARMPTP